MEDNAMTKQKILAPGTTRREAMALISGAVAGMALGGNARAQGAPKRGGILRISAFTNPSSLDPTTGGAGSDHAFLFTMYDTLTEWDYETLKPKPGLAESWNFIDPTTFVLNIRPDVTFHDGTPLDAEAVKFNFERNKSDPKSNIKADLATVASVEITGPMQITLKLNTPDAAMPGILSDRAGMMVSPSRQAPAAISLALRWAPVPMLLSVGRMANVSLSSAMKNTGRQTVLTPMASSLRSFPS